MPKTFYSTLCPIWCKLIYHYLNLKELPEDNQIVKLRTALQNLPPDCLLVLDNANNPDDIKAFKKAFSGLHWHVLLTSRCQHVLEDKQEMLIAHLPPVSAKALFCSYYKEETADFNNLLDRILIAIGYNTLLIELFAKNMALLAKLGETLADLLSHLETKGLFLGERSFEIVTPYTVHNHREAATIDAIIDALYDLTQLEESERRLLVNLALLPAESHVLTLLIDLFLPTDKFAFLAQLSKLAQRGWLITDTESYRLSPVVQKIIVAKNKPTLWDDAKDLVELLSDLLYPEMDKTNVIAKSKWLKYAQPLLAQFHELNDTIYFELLTNVAIVLHDLRGGENLTKAQKLLEKALQSYVDHFGEQDPTVAASQSNLAAVLENLGGKANLEMAYKLRVKALYNIAFTYGPLSIEVTVQQSNLAQNLRLLGGNKNLVEAVSLFESSIKIGIRLSGETDPSVCISQTNLAIVLLDLGGRDNLSKAKSLLQKAINNGSATTHSVAVRQSNLAMVLQKLGEKGDLQQAQGLLEEALKKFINMLGENHPDVARCQKNLADILMNLSLDNRKEACQLYLKAYKTMRKAYGDQHESTKRYHHFLLTCCRDSDLR